MNARLVSKYGSSKPARYFVKSLDDLLDVVETVYKHISQKTDGPDLAELLHAIECSAVPIPRTLSSHIFCFGIPENLLDSDNRPTNVSGRLPELSADANSLPQIVHQETKTQLRKDVRTLYDILVFQRYFRLFMSQNSDGIKMFTTKRSAEISAVPLPDNKIGFQLTVSFPGIIFKGSAVTSL